MVTHPVTLLFADGVSHRMHVAEGTGLVEAAAADGLTLLTDCSNGQCGTCTGQLCSGTVRLEEYDRAVLPDGDREAGSILPCVSSVDGPCVIELPYDFSEASAEEQPPISGRIAGITKVAEETMQLEIDIESPLVFEPGQYVRMRPPGQEQWRSYSMASPSGHTRLVFYVRLVKGGMFSDWLSDSAEVGGEIELSVPRGSFFLRDEERPRLFVAGGTGLAPFLSMLASIADDPARQRHSTTLLVGVRTAGHLFATDQLDACRVRLPNLYISLAAETGQANGCRPGYATDLIAGLGLDPRTRVYLCGPPPMVDAGRNACVVAGIARNDVLCERFA